MTDDKRSKRDARDQRDDVIETPDEKDERSTEGPNAPRTTAGGWTSPKFGSAGSGGAELEPGPERD